MTKKKKNQQQLESLKKEELSSGACLTGFQLKFFTCYVYGLGKVAQLT